MAAPGALSPTPDESYLRPGVEGEPACLIRVRLDGVLLACNQAAVGLFGVADRRAVLGSTLTDRLVPAERAQWQEFVARCRANGAASFEGQLVVGNETARPVLMQGVALNHHPDGVESLLLHLRDRSQTQRPADSIQNAAIDRLDDDEGQRARDQIVEAFAEQLDLGVLAGNEQGERNQLIEAKFLELEKKLQHSQLVLQQKQREFGRDVAMLKSALSAARAAKASAASDEKQELEAARLRLQTATAEQARLQNLVGEYETDCERIVADHQATVGTLQQSLARAHDEAAATIEQSRQALVESHAELAQARAEQTRLAAHVEEERRSKDAALIELGSQLARASAERDGLAERVEAAERGLELQRAEHERAHEHLVTEHRRTLADVETTNREALEAVTLRLQTATTEQTRLQSLVAEYEADRERAAAGHQTAIDTLQQAFARAREEAALEAEQSRQALAESRSELAQALAEHTRIAARAEEETRSKDAALVELGSQLAQAAAEQSSLAAHVVEAERELQQQHADHERAHEHLVAEHQRALADVETGKREAVHAVTLSLQAVTTEQGRLQNLVAEYEADRGRAVADHQAAVDALQHALARAREDAALEDEQSRLALTAARSELAQALDEHSRKAARAEEEARSKDAALAELQSWLARMSAEHETLTARVEATGRELELQRAEHERAHERLVAEHHRALADLESGKHEALEELRSQHSQALADQRRLGSRLEESERERDALIAEHHRVLAEMESSKRDALAELRSQLSQAFADQRRLASHADGQELELNRLRAEHHAALTDMETRNRDALAELRAELSQTAERAEQHARERDRVGAEHAVAIAGLQASHEAAAVELRSQLSQAVAEHHRLAALLEEHERERERIAAEHRRAIADLQASKQEAVAECERLLTEVQQALLVRDSSRRLEVERRLNDGIDDSPRIEADVKRLASFQRGLAAAFSQVQAVLRDGPTLRQPVEATQAVDLPTFGTIEKVATTTTDEKRLEDVDPLQEPFDDADDAFVLQLLGGVGAANHRADLTEAGTGGAAEAAPGPQPLTTGDQAADDLFDAHDATFVRRLMNTPDPLRESAEQAAAEPAQELPETQPSTADDS